MDAVPSQVSISNFPCDFSDPIDLDEFETPRDAHPPSIPQMGDLQLPFDEAIKQLEGLVGLRASYTTFRKGYMGCCWSFGSDAGGVDGGSLDLPPISKLSPNCQFI